MEEVQEHKKHECKLCNQSFSNGKSLGGHMRIHVANDSSKMGFEGGEQSGYILRDNPKKSWRIPDSNHGDSRNENQCKVCGKGFPKMRALNGHMRHHSRKERGKNYCKECGKGFGSLKALFGHMRCHSDLHRVVDKQSEDETSSSLTHTKRPRTKRYKITANSLVSDFNAYSCDTGIEPEVEEVAMILMMLSRGVRVWGGVDSIAECFLGGKLLNQEKGMSENGGGRLVCNVDQGLKMNMPIVKKLESCISDDGDVMLGEEVSEVGDLDSGVLSNGENKVELEDSIEGFLRSDELKKSNLEKETRTELSDTVMGEEFLDEVKLGKDLENEHGSNQAGSESRKPCSRKKARMDAYDPELGGNFWGEREGTSDYEVFDNNSSKKGEYKCRTCYKVFGSHQALGGHRARHHKAYNCPSLPKIKRFQEGIHTSLLADVETNGKLVKVEHASNFVEHELVGTITTSCKLKKSKVHECSICFKVFSSGQALGGHMRAHCAGNTDHSDNHDVFDVNLLDTLGADAKGHVGFKPWSFGSDNNHEQLADAKGHVGFKPWSFGSDNNHEQLVGVVSN